jgi:hypothetical protein
MAAPPEEELGLVMKHFVGNVSGYAAFWMDVAGDYVLRVLSQRDFNFSTALGQPDRPIIESRFPRPGIDRSQ